MGELRTPEQPCRDQGETHQAGVCAKVLEQRPAWELGTRGPGGWRWSSNSEVRGIVHGALEATNPCHLHSTPILYTHFPGNTPRPRHTRQSPWSFGKWASHSGLFPNVEKLWSLFPSVRSNGSLLGAGMQGGMRPLWKLPQDSHSLKSLSPTGGD